MQSALRVIVEPRGLPPPNHSGGYALARGGRCGGAHRGARPAHVAAQEHRLVAGGGGRGSAGAVGACVALRVEGPRGQAWHRFAVGLAGSWLLGELLVKIAYGGNFFIIIIINKLNLFIQVISHNKEQ